MAIEATLICDLCSSVIDAARTAPLVRDAVKRDNVASRIKANGKFYDVCHRCRAEKGGEGAVRAILDMKVKQ